MNALFNEQLPTNCKRKHEKWVMREANLIKKIVKGRLTSGAHPCFYDIILMILSEKSLIESFVVFSSVLTNPS